MTTYKRQVFHAADKQWKDNTAYKLSASITEAEAELLRIDWLEPNDAYRLLELQDGDPARIGKVGNDGTKAIVVWVNYPPNRYTLELWNRKGSWEPEAMFTNLISRSEAEKHLSNYIQVHSADSVRIIEHDGALVVATAKATIAYNEPYKINWIQTMSETTQPPQDVKQPLVITDNLREKPSELLYDALVAFKRLEMDGGFKAVMNEFHNEKDGVIQFCLAGAALHTCLSDPRASIASLTLCRTPVSNKLYAKLRAIDSLRTGEILAAINWLKLPSPKLLVPRVKVTLYRENPIQCRIDLYELSENLAAVGL